MKRVILSLLLSCLLLFPSLADAARLFTSGFETNDFTATEWSTSASATIQTASPHSGTYNGQVTAGQVFTRNLSALKTSGTVTTRFYWKTSTTASDNEFFRVNSTGGARNVGVYKLAGGTIKLQNGATLSIATTTFAVSINTWYRIEIQHVLKDAADPTGSITLNIYVGDSTTASDTVSITNEDTVNTDIFTWKFQEATTGATVFSFDDVAINDETGTFQTSWPGPRKIAMLVPNGDAAVAWTKGGTPEATNFGGVDDEPGTPNDATDFNFDSGSTNEDRLDLTDLPAEVTSDATIALMDVYARVNSTGSGTMALKVWNQVPTGTEGPTFTVNSATWRILTTAQHQVYDLTGVSKDTVSQYSAGYIAKSNTSGQKQATSLWANVEWIESAGGAPAQTFFNRRLQQ